MRKAAVRRLIGQLNRLVGLESSEVVFARKAQDIVDEESFLPSIEKETFSIISLKMELDIAKAAFGRNQRPQARGCRLEAGGRDLGPKVFLKPQPLAANNNNSGLSTSLQNAENP